MKIAGKNPRRDAVLRELKAMGGGSWIPLIVLLVLLVLVFVGAYFALTMNSDIPLPNTGYFAMTIGILFSLVPYRSDGADFLQQPPRLRRGADRGEGQGPGRQLIGPLLSAAGVPAAGLALLLLLAPALAGAQDQTRDKRYCAALLDRYLRYAGVTEYPGTPGKVTNDSSAGIAQAKCQAGDTDGGIRILERKLSDAKLDLPPALTIRSSFRFHPLAVVSNDRPKLPAN
jgi:hypothetical protein